MDLIEIAEGEGINTFAVLQLVDVVATDDLIGLVREERLHHKGAQPFLTLDDIDQAHYTSMHASEADELYLPEDDEVTDWDTPGAESAYERRVLAHVAAQLQRPELQHDHRALRRECAPESVATPGGGQ